MKIPFLSAKNKKLGMTALMWFGLAVLGFIIARAWKAGGEVKEKLASAKDEVKDLFRLSMIAVPLAASVYFFSTGEIPLACLALLSPGGASMLLGINLGTLTTGAAVVSTFTTTYVPKWFMYTAATQLTGVKITVQGDGVIFDSDAAGLNHAGVNRLVGQTTNSYLFTISNGFIKGKNVIWEFTNSAAQTPIVYVDSDETPLLGDDNVPMYLQFIRQAVLANSGINFKKFATCSLPGLAAADQVNILYADGTQQTWLRADLQIALGLTQNIVNTPVYMVDNFDMRIQEINVIAAANQTAYIQRWVGAGGGMVNQSVNS